VCFTSTANLAGLKRQGGVNLGKAFLVTRLKAS